MMAGVAEEGARKLDPAETFVFLDIETTGLYGSCNITELAMHTFSKKDFAPEQKGKRIRLLGKLTMCFNPAMRIDPKASQLSGLYNDMLENLNKFDHNAANLIISYLNHFPQPICLIAHNGNRFDFPIIKKSFDKLGLKLPNTVLCADSLDIIRKIDSNEEEKYTAFLENEYNEIIKAEAGIKAAENQEYMLEEIRAIENLVKAGLFADEDSVESEPRAESAELNELFDPTNNHIKQRQKRNETTPRRGFVKKFNRIHAKKEGEGQNGSSDDGGKQLDGNESKSRRELFPGSKVAGGKVVKAKKPFKSYKLGDIYERIFKEKPEVAHAAEADVVTMHRIAFHYNEEFAQMVEIRAFPFADIKINR